MPPDPPPDSAPDAYQLLRRELVRAQARLKRAERERDALAAENARLKARLRVHEGKGDRGDDGGSGG